MLGKPPHLTSGEYVVRNEDDQDDQIASARWQFLRAVDVEVPNFIEALRNEVYPEYARFAACCADYWLPGSRFDEWQSQSDPQKQLTETLLRWACKFNVENEIWLLEGALQTLSDWYLSPARRDSPEIHAFRPSIVIPGMISVEDHPFHFAHRGWDPTFEDLDGWQKEVRQHFDEEFEAYERQMRKRVEQLGAIPTVPRYTPEHFQWLASFQCGNLSLAAILKRAPHAANSSTISKGIHTAARLAAITVRPNRRKLKNV